MTPNFAKAVDPVFDYVLRTVEKIENGAEPDPEYTQSRIIASIQFAESMLGESDDEWDFAKFALCCWIDDLLLSAPWRGRDWWVERILETKLCKSQNGAVLFYQFAKEAALRTRRDAHEVYYLCVILGFRGIYADPEQNAAELYAQALPPTLYQWLTTMADGIRKPPPSAVPPQEQASSVAVPLKGRALMAQALLLAAVTSAVAVLTAYFVFM